MEKEQKCSVKRTTRRELMGKKAIEVDVAK